MTVSIWETQEQVSPSRAAAGLGHPASRLEALDGQAEPPQDSKVTDQVHAPGTASRTLRWPPLPAPEPVGDSTG